MPLSALNWKSRLTRKVCGILQTKLTLNFDEHNSTFLKPVANFTFVRREVE